jgi:hypothetical protein
MGDNPFVPESLRGFVVASLLGGLLLSGLARAQDARAPEVVRRCAENAEDGQRMRTATDLVSARADFAHCSVDACPPAIRADCLRWLTEVEHELPTIVIRARDARTLDVIGARVFIDDVLTAEQLTGGLLPLNPGPHRVKLVAAGGAVTSEQLLVAVGEKARLVPMTFAVALDSEGRPLAAPHDPSGGGKTREGSSLALPLALGGLGLAALGFATFFELSGQSDYRALRAGCGRTASCSPADVDSSKRKLDVFAPVSLTVGVVALAAGAFLLVRSLEAAPRHDAALRGDATLSSR